MHRLDHAYQKSITHLLAMQKILILLCQCVICQNIVTIILASGSLWNCYRDEINDSGNESNDADNYRINNNKTTASKCFEYKTKIMGRRPNDNILDAEIVVPLKYLSNFWRSFDFSLINCEIELDLSWSRYCVGSQL